MTTLATHRRPGRGFRVAAGAVVTVALLGVSGCGGGPSDEAKDQNAKLSNGTRASRLDDGRQALALAQQLVSAYAADRTSATSWTKESEKAFITEHQLAGYTVTVAKGTLVLDATSPSGCVAKLSTGYDTDAEDETPAEVTCYKYTYTARDLDPRPAAERKKAISSLAVSLATTVLDNATPGKKKISGLTTKKVNTQFGALLGADSRVKILDEGSSTAQLQVKSAGCSAVVALSDVKLRASKVTCD